MLLAPDASGLEAALPVGARKLPLSHVLLRRRVSDARVDACLKTLVAKEVAIARSEAAYTVV